MSRFIHKSKIFSINDTQPRCTLRETLKSSIVLLYKLNNNRLTADIYTCSDVETEFTSVPCDILLGDILSNNVLLDADLLENGQLKEEIIDLGYATFLPTDLFVAKFDVEKLNNYNTLSEYLLYNWNELYIDELRVFNFVNSFLEYYTNCNIKNTFEILEYLITFEQINVPKSKSIVSDKLSNKNIIAFDLYEYEKTFKYVFDNFDTLLKNAHLDTIKKVQVDDIANLSLSLLYEIIKNGQTLKKCENCGKWFSPTKADEKYCSRIIDGVSCKQDASRKVRRETLAKKPYQKQYNSINTMLANKLKRKNLTEKEKNQYRDELFAFRDEALIFKEEIKNGTKTIEEFTEWLNSFKKGAKR